MLGEQVGLPIWRTRFCKVQARMKQIVGDFDDAVALLNEAESLNYITPVPDIMPIQAMKAHVWIKQGHIHRASSWAQDRGLTLDRAVTYLNEYELMTLARLHIVLIENSDAANTIHALTNLLERLLDAAENDKRMGSVIEIRILQARLHWMLQSQEQALDMLQQALKLAEPEGYVRTFVDEGMVMREMLSEAVAQDIFPSYSQKLLRAFKSTSPASQPLIDPLSERELEILQLIGDGLSNREVSERLFIALDTVKGHNRNIYQKLQVKRRTEAVARARELGLI